jgi:hypothetical protein
MVPTGSSSYSFAYVRLVYRPQRACACRGIVVAGRIGSIDVRLTELVPEAGASGQPPI